MLLLLMQSSHLAFGEPSRESQRASQRLTSDNRENHFAGAHDRRAHDRRARITGLKHYVFCGSSQTTPKRMFTICEAPGMNVRLL